MEGNGVPQLWGNQVVNHATYNQESVMEMTGGLSYAPAHVSHMGADVGVGDQFGATPPPPPFIADVQGLVTGPQLPPAPPSVYSQSLAECFHRLQKDALRESAMKANTRPQLQAAPQPHIHYVLPRKKIGGQTPSSKEAVALSHSKICSLFHLRQMEAAKELVSGAPYFLFLLAFLSDSGPRFLLLLLLLSSYSSCSCNPCRALGIFKWPNHRSPEASEVGQGPHKEATRRRQEKEQRTAGDVGRATLSTPASPLEAIQIPETWEASSSSSLPPEAQPVELEPPEEIQMSFFNTENVSLDEDSELDDKTLSLHETGSSTCFDQYDSPSQSGDVASSAGSKEDGTRTREGSQPTLASLSGGESAEDQGDVWVDWFVPCPLNVMLSKEDD
eukprot:441345-Hanusia_phi.AAC.1